MRMEPIKARADFEVYLKKFLRASTSSCRGAAAHRYRGPARRLGYLMRMTKERFKDDSIEFRRRWRKGRRADQQASHRTGRRP